MESSWCLVLWCAVAWCAAAAASGARVRRVVGGRVADPPPPDAAVIFVQKNGRSARIEGTHYNASSYYEFLGIRYGEAPRFQRPSLVWPRGELSATRPCAPCPQPGAGSEDCLCLNIYAPTMPHEITGSPVLFWIHGGGFRRGSGTLYGGQHLTQKDVLVVSVQYRLGSLGFLSTGDHALSGNAGLFDVAIAYQWVQDYISFFGGDASRVVVGGQGSGASGAALMGRALAPSGVLALSGAPLSQGAVDDEPAAGATRLARATRCPAEPIDVALACLKKLPAEDIVQADSENEELMINTEGFLKALSGDLGERPVVDGAPDGRYLPTLVHDAPAHDAPPPLPILTGVVRDETANGIFGTFNQQLSKSLKEIPEFIKTRVISPLRSSLQNIAILKEVENALPVSAVANVVALSFENYYDTVQNTVKNGPLNITEGLLKITEATGDALFNFPAVATLHKWAKKSASYLYSFEYKGNKAKGNHFLKGLPLLGNNGQANNFVSHGDELAYLFEPLDLAGRPVEPDSARDKRQAARDDAVRDDFTDLVSQFVHGDKMHLGNGGTVVPPFDRASNNFIQISSDIKLVKNFRVCQMALWANLVSQLQSASCSALSGAAQLAEGVLSPVTGVLAKTKPKLPNSQLSGPLGSNTKVKLPGLGGLFSK